MSATRHDIGAVAIGYTLGTGRLFCHFRDLQEYAEHLLQAPILTHELGDERLFQRLRARFEAVVLDELEARRP